MNILVGSVLRSIILSSVKEIQDAVNKRSFPDSKLIGTEITVNIGKYTIERVFGEGLRHQDPNVLVNTVSFHTESLDNVLLSNSSGSCLYNIIVTGCVAEYDKRNEKAELHLTFDLEKLPTLDIEFDNPLGGIMGGL